MKKVYHINSVLGLGSTGRIMHAIGECADRNGYESYYAYGRASSMQGYNVYEIGTKFDNMMHLARTRLLDQHGFGSASATKKLIKYIESLKPDLIHLHNVHGYYINIEILFDYLNKSNIPVVWTLHDCWPFTGHCSHFSLQECDKWKTQCENCPQMKSYPSSLLRDRSRLNYLDKKRLFTQADSVTITTVSNWLKSVTDESFLNKHSIVAIHNGTNTDIFYPRDNAAEVKSKYQLKGKYLLLAAATSWSDSKGLPLYNQLAELLPSEYDLILIGINEKQKATLNPRILTLPRTNSQDELAELYSLADITLNLSKQETFGLTTAESFACGTPSIVLNKTASPELITEGTGIIVMNDTVEEIIKAIFSIIEKGKDFYRNACRERALTHYNQKIQFQKYIDLYNEILNRSH